jgi:peptidoglycan-associated lipoprotein
MMASHLGIQCDFRGRIQNMKGNRLAIAMLGVLLVGCSDLATKDAPIEERSKATVSTATKDGAAATSAPGTGASPAGTSGAGTGTAGAGTATSGTGSAGVQTHGTELQGVEVRPLAGTSTDAQAGASGSAAKYAGMRTPPKDVAGPLSKRVIYFDYDSSTIKDEYREVIQAHSEFIKASKEARSILQGHTDERGSRDYNLALGQRRAESVQQALVVLGVDQMKLEAVSLGEEKPVKEGHDEDAWSKNRRVEIYYQGE